ncbi:hypothetical protein H4R35_006941, partial [Dimargaris xerosporica]
MSSGMGRRSSVRISWFHTTSDSIATLPDPPLDASPASRTATGFPVYSAQPTTAAAAYTGRHVLRSDSYSAPTEPEPYEEYVVARHFRHPPPPISYGRSRKPSQRECHVDFANHQQGHHSTSQPQTTNLNSQTQRRS